MITVDQLPEAAVDAARIAMAESLARDGDGIPECIAAAINRWPQAITGFHVGSGNIWVKLPITSNATNMGGAATTRSGKAVEFICNQIRIMQFPIRMLSVLEMQELTGMTGRALNYEFQRRFKCSPIQWQRNTRLDQAREDLLNGNQSIKAVSKRYGFPNSAAFSRAYSRRFGELPRQTRENIGVVISMRGDGNG